MRETYNLRLQELHMTAKDLWKECNRRGRKISYATVTKMVSGYDPMATTRQKVEKTLDELEEERHGKLH